MAVIGTCWATGSWADPDWAANTWAGAVIPVVVAPTMAPGARIPFQKRKYTRVTPEDFGDAPNDAPHSEPVAHAVPVLDPPRPTIARGPALPADPGAPALVAFPSIADTDDAIARRHAARVAAVEAARERIRMAAEQRAHALAVQAEHHRLAMEAHVARQTRARNDASMMSLLLQLDDL